MPRPQRIEYENAFYHVMDRGRERYTIFNGDEYYLCFLETLAQAQLRFKCIVHAYCLMGNHYHLLIETPNANLGGVMRHIKKDRGSSCLINKTMGSLLYVCQDLNELNMKMLFTM
jgi:REP element-mobilizing transposase RayT